MRSIQSLATGTTGSATQVTVSLSGLSTDVGGEPANVVGFGIRVSKTITSIVRPFPAVVIRDSSEPLFDSTFLELLAQQRERGEAIVAQLGAVTAIDSASAVWRPGYGAEVKDAGHAAGLFQGGGSIVLTFPTDAGQTFTYEVIAYLDTNSGLRIAPRAITRTLSATTRDLQGDFLLARLRDGGFLTTASYSVRNAARELLTSISGLSLQHAYESSLGPAGDPVVLTAVAQTTIATPNLIRAMLNDFSYGAGEKTPPVSMLPDSRGTITLTSGFAGAPTVTYLYPRTRGEAEALARTACNRHGVPYRAPIPAGNDPSLYLYMPLKLVG